MPTCKADCAYRTCGRYRRTSGGRFIPNKRCRKGGVCKNSPIVNEQGLCTTFQGWDRIIPKSMLLTRWMDEGRGVR